MAESAPISGQVKELLRLVERTTYGGSRAWTDLVESMGYEGFLDWQLQGEDIDDGGLEDALLGFLPTLSMDAATLANHIFEERNFGAAQRDLTIATIIRQIFSPRQLLERMVEFWSDHFNVPINSVQSGFLKTLEDRDMVRPLALSTFEDLLMGSAKSPAMLFYLDNFSSTAEGPNENYAREMFELHTLGVDGGYTEDDIKETARVFTGWSIAEPAQFNFYSIIHDYGSKTVLGQVIEPTGLSEGEGLLRRLATHEATARFISTKLVRRFVADDPETEVVDAVAQAFLDSGGDIRVTLKALLMLPPVRQTLALKLKRPNEFSASMLRALEVEMGEYPLNGHYQALVAGGQIPFSWPAPNGYPDARAYWQSTNGFLMRFNQASALPAEVARSSALLREASGLAGLDAQIDLLERGLRPQGLTADERRLLKRYSRRLPAGQRPAALASWILGGPEAQWR
ncbi:hypothetical protein AY599_05430 [Leptolyngbya valderiana BDU 20041]|nr:hypothetical protein AY599_05430 [Leptolyngbya valderiana BDU 20041]